MKLRIHKTYDEPSLAVGVCRAYRFFEERQLYVAYLDLWKFSFNVEVLW